MRRSLLSVHREPSEELRRLRSAPIPHGDVMAAAVTDAPLDQESILERSRNVSTATDGMPVIRLCGKYNKRWYVDVVALPHDSIRIVLQHMFSIAAAVQRLVLDMTAQDFEKLFAFAKELDAYTRVILEAEEKILFPSIESSLRKLKLDGNHPLTPQNRALAKASIRTLLAKILADETHENITAALIQEWRQTLDDLSRCLVDYFAAKESVLPRLVATSIRGSREKKRLERQLLRFFADCGQQYHYAALLTAPLHLEEVRADFEERHFSKEQKPLYRAALDDVKLSLFAIPKSFERAAQKYEAKFSMSTFLDHYGHAVPQEEVAHEEDDEDQSAH